MPEAPDLVVIREFLLTRLVGDEIVTASERKPLVLRNMQDVDFENCLRGRGKITAITANKRETSYSRTCQPGSFFDQ